MICDCDCVLHRFSCRYTWSFWVFKVLGDSSRSGHRVEVAKSPAARWASLLMKMWQMKPCSLGPTHTKWSMARTSTHTGASDAEENKVAHPSDSSRTCKARWLLAAVGKKPGSEWCFHWGHWEVSTWGWSGTKSWRKRWGPGGLMVLGKHFRKDMQYEVMGFLQQTTTTWRKK